jgi:peptidoglycan/xylan/chitin deacetylase (PgdA/CDA1 family)
VLKAALSTPAAAACTGTIYLTFDTGSQSQAELIADTLKRHHIKATFFLANEKTVRGDWSLDPSWAAYWKARVAEGHAFGTHTFDHVYYKGDGANGGSSSSRSSAPHAGKQQTWTAAQYCDELQRVDQRFVELTGRHLDPIWRAPGGHLAARAGGRQVLRLYPRRLGAGRLLGRRTSSAAYPECVLLKRALAA